MEVEDIKHLTLLDAYTWFVAQVPDDRERALETMQRLDTELKAAEALGPRS